MLLLQLWFDSSLLFPGVSRSKIKTSTTTAAAPTTTPTAAATTTTAPITTNAMMISTTTIESITKASSSSECGNGLDTTTQNIDCVTENEAKDTTVETQTTNPPNMLRIIARNKPMELMDSSIQGNTSPWSWARNIMLEKPVLKKSATL